MKYILFISLLLTGHLIFANNITIKGKVTMKGSGEAIPGVQVAIRNSSQVVLTEADGSYKLTNIPPGEHTIIAFFLGLQTQQKEFEVVDGVYVVNFVFSEKSQELSAVTIRHTREKTEGLTRLNAVDGYGIYESKKNEVIVLDDLIANKASNNPRQIFAKVSGLNIWESDCAGLQIGVGSRGLSPNRNSNFNTRQNGYDISADALGYPESYYSPAIQAVERIEIVRGAASLQYGTQFGGLVNFVMKDGPDDKKIELTIEQTGNSLGFYSGFNSVGGTIGKVNYYAYNRYAVGDCWRCNSEFESTTSYGKVKVELTDDLSFSGEYTNMYYQAKQPGGLTDVLFEENAKQSIRERNWFRVNWNLFAFDINYKISQKLRVNIKNFGLIGGRDALGNLSRIDRTDDLQERDLFVDDFSNWGNETRFIYNYNLGKQPSVLLVGGRYYKGLTKRQQGLGNKGYDPEFIFLNPDNLEESDFRFPGKNVALFAENIFNLSDKISITPGLRYENLNIKPEGYYRDKVLVPDPQTGLAKDSVFQVNVSSELPRNFLLFGLGGSYKPTESAELYMNFSQNYRAIDFSNARVGNPNLVVDPEIYDESGYNVDLGVRGGINGIFNYDVSAFCLKYNGRIGAVLKSDPQTFRIYRYRTNVSDSRNYGVEAFGEVNILHLLNPVSEDKAVLNLFANLSLIEAVYINSEETSIDGNKVELVPPVSIKTGLSYAKDKLKLSYQLSYTHEHFTDATNVIFTPSAIEGIIPSYYVMDLGGSYQLNEYFGIEAGVNNLTDNIYFTRRATGYPGPGIIPADGRSFYLTLKGRI